MAEIIRTKIGVLTYLAPTGPISDKEGLSALEEMISACLKARDVNLVVDLERVPTLNSVTLELLLDMQDRLARNNGVLKVMNANALIQDIFLVTGFGDYIAVIDPSQGGSI